MSNVVARPRVVVLMSTYQGELYVAEQLRSILAQLPEHGRIFVRDDGSKDGTVVAIEALRDPRIDLARGSNCGFGQSFLTLLAAAPPESDMVMFADQDDVWLPDKIERAWRHLREFADRPALYGSAQMLADDSLRPLRATPPWPRGPSFVGALTENIITGCTAALNRPALVLLQRAGVPPEVRFHDWWLYLVVSAFGAVVHDDEPSLLYRQHEGNQIGHGVGRIGRYLQMTRFVVRNDWVGILLGQVWALRRCYGSQLESTKWELLERYFLFRPGMVAPAWRLIFSLRRWRQELGKEMLLRALLAAHRLRLWPLPSRRLCLAEEAQP